MEGQGCTCGTGQARKEGPCSKGDDCCRTKAKKLVMQTCCGGRCQ